MSKGTTSGLKCSTGSLFHRGEVEWADMWGGGVEEGVEEGELEGKRGEWRWIEGKRGRGEHTVHSSTASKRI